MEISHQSLILTHVTCLMSAIYLNHDSILFKMMKRKSAVCMFVKKKVMNKIRVRARLVQPQRITLKKNYLKSQFLKMKKKQDVKCLISSESGSEEINHEQLIRYKSLPNRILRNPANINV